MKINSFAEGYLIIDDTFSKDELVDIWRDIEHIEQNDLFLSPEKTGSAKDPEQGFTLKENKAIFLDKLYQNNIIKCLSSCTKKLFTIEIAKAFSDIHPGLSIFENLNFSHSLLSYYESGDYYKPHVDNSVFTMLTWLYREPKGWAGGNLVLNDWDTIIESRNNRTLIIPGSFYHAVETVNMHTEKPYMGRYCLTTFGFVKPTKGLL